MNENFSNNDRGHAGSSMMTGFVVGALVGAGIALLLAPATGQDMRRRLGETARRVRDEARSKVGQARETLSHLKEDARTAIDSGREAFTQHRQTRRDQASQGTPPAPYAETGGPRPI